jgi:alkanesulfonate monooxygenase SsuD/methylene tetrahydromethanopterin reductase-like flavin-dependent oxidoreductase (luciferase family)
VIVERWNGIPFERPLSRVRETVGFLREALAGERAGEGGFRLEQPPPAPVPIVVAALRGKMLRTAGEIGDGCFINFTPISGLPRVIEEIREGERAAGKEPGSGDVLCRFFCVQADPEQALGVARWLFTAYATVPVYEQFFRWLGHGEAIDPMVRAWREGDRAKASELVPDDLVREIFILGDPDAQLERLAAFREGGVNCPVLQLIPAAAPGTAMEPETYLELVESLAPAA